MALDYLTYEKILLALAVWREARGEPEEVWRWVAWTVFNRCRRAGWWNPSGSVSGALLAPWQYSSITDPKDPQLTKFPLPQRDQQCQWRPDPTYEKILDLVDSESRTSWESDPTSGADSYFDLSIPPPKWATSDKFIRQVGRIRFYRVLA